jgi:hypothetical protein
VDIYLFLVCGTNFGFCAPMPAPAPICAFEAFAAGDIGRAAFPAGLPITFGAAALRVIVCFINVFLCLRR